MIFFMAIVTLLMGFTEGLIPAEPFIATLFITIYGGFIATLVAVNIKDLANLKAFPQAILFVIFITLLWLGS